MRHSGQLTQDRILDMCYTEKATPARHRPGQQYNAVPNRRKQCSPNETKSYSNPTPPRKRQNNIGYVVDMLQESCDPHMHVHSSWQGCPW